MHKYTMERLFSVCVVLVYLSGRGAGERGDYVGCYPLAGALDAHTGQSADVCLEACEQLHYRYAIIGNHSTCFCDNTPGALQLDAGLCDTPCPKNESQRCGGAGVASVYDTDVSAPGAPADIQVYNITESTLRVRWVAPEARNFISAYVVRATVVRTYSDLVLIPLEWRRSNDTFQTELLNLQPGSLYNVSVAAVNEDEEGPAVSVEAETVIGTPDPTPPDIQITERHGDKMVVHIPEAKNVNGPVSMYRIVVSIELYQQGFIVDTLGDYNYARERGLPYYITAELDPDDIKHDFTIGDRHTYNGFYNAPLPLTNDIDVSLGVVSEKGPVRKIRYAESAKRIILNINEPEEVSPLMLALGAGIAIGVVLLLVGVGLIIVLRKRIHTARLQRGSQCLPLSASEPCLEIENSGFMRDDDERVDYYADLKRKLRNIPRDLVEIDISCVVGLGSYGKFTRGTVRQRGERTPALIQVIPDRELDAADRKTMLQELDSLIRTNEHENVISLIGICETDTALLVVLEDSHTSLKEHLLQSRRRDPLGGRFCQLAESAALQLCADVARGMDYLHQNKILHKRLACRNVMVTAGGAARVAGFGPALARPPHGAPDYTRWTAHEMLRQSRFNPKADVWSYGVLVWEILTVGATPYPQYGNAEVAARVAQGARPAQPAHAADELFMLALQCWQTDRDERPAFPALLRQLAALPPTALSFTHYEGFDFDPYIPHYEIVS